jgi:hypothetical protein
VTAIANVTSCSGGCTAGAVGIAATAPTALTSDRAGTLYIADGGINVLRFVPSTGQQVVIANTGLVAGTATTFAGVTALGLDGAGTLMVGDDPTGGAQTLQGHLWQVLLPTTP